MELRRLQHLVALADTGNFGKAAVACHITQSAFSRSIQSAEEELGLKLFDRGTLLATCTDAGNFVVERARKLIFENRCLLRDVELYRDRQVGDLNFGAGPFPAAAVVPGLLVEMRTHYPGVHVRVEVNNADYLAQHLRNEELDFYLADLRNVIAADDLTVQRVGQIGANFYVRHSHPLLSQATLRPSMLLPFGIASVRVPGAVAAALGKFMGMKDGAPIQLAVECDDLTLLKSLALSTDTVVACADAAAMREVSEGQLVRLDQVGLPPMFADLALVSLKGRSFSLIADFAREFIAQQTTH